MILKDAKFLASYQTVDRCPPPDKPEYAFIGRSNVGKSSLINMIVEKKNLAKTSGTPGKTQLINLFQVDSVSQISNRKSINETWLVTDLPGYGFAKISKTKREEWNKMIEDYLRKRTSLMTVFALVDSRLEPQGIDIEFIDSVGKKSIPLVIVFTKADKLSQKELAKNVNAFLEELKNSWEEVPPHIITSAAKKRGQKEMLDYIEKSNKEFKV